MDWVHCNSCFYQLGHLPKRDFKLTSCGHMFCSYCERSGSIEQCKECNNKCSSTPLSANMAKEVQIYFEDPDKMLRDQILKVLEFQKGHRIKLNEHYGKVFEKYQQAKRTIQKLQEKVVLLERKLQEERKNRVVDNSQFLTPPSQPTLSSFRRTSQSSNPGSAIYQGSVNARSPANSIFATPTSHQYRSQRLSPSPSPLSSVSSNSPVNFFSKNNYGSYKPGLTPPLHGLSLLSFNNMKSRNTRY